MARIWCLCPVLFHPTLSPAEFGGQLTLVCAYASDTTWCSIPVSKLSRGKQQHWLLSSPATKGDCSNFSVAMTLTNAGQKHAQGITKHILESPKKDMESKAKGYSLSSPRNTMMLQPQRVYVN